MLFPMLLFSLHTHASCTPHFIHLHAMHGYVLPCFSSILPLPSGCLMFHFISILWLLLRLSTPNIISMDLVIFLFFLYLIRLTYDSHAALFFSHYAACTPHFIHFRAVHGYALLLSSILPPPCGCLMLYFLSIPWPCLMHASTSCY